MKILDKKLMISFGLIFPKNKTSKKKCENDVLSLSMYKLRNCTLVNLNYKTYTVIGFQKKKRGKGYELRKKDFWMQKEIAEITGFIKGKDLTKS